MLLQGSKLGLLYILSALKRRVPVSDAMNFGVSYVSDNVVTPKVSYGIETDHKLSDQLKAILLEFRRLRHTVECFHASSLFLSVKEGLPTVSRALIV